MITVAIPFTIKLEDDQVLSYDSFPTMYLYSPTENIVRLQLNAAQQIIIVRGMTECDMLGLVTIR